MDRAWLTLGSCALPIAFLVTIFGTVVLLRWFKHREILALAEKGLLPAQYAQYVSASRGRGLLGWGIALVALGLALMIGLWPLGFAMRPGGHIEGPPYPLYFGPWMLMGLIPLFTGLALLITYFVVRKEEAPAPETTSVEEAEVSVTDL